MSCHEELRRDLGPCGQGEQLAHLRLAAQEQLRLMPGTDENPQVQPRTGTSNWIQMGPMAIPGVRPTRTRACSSQVASQPSSLTRPTLTLFTLARSRVGYGKQWMEGKPGHPDSKCDAAARRAYSDATLACSINRHSSREDVHSSRGERAYSRGKHIYPAYNISL